MTPQQFAALGGTMVWAHYAGGTDGVFSSYQEAYDWASRGNCEPYQWKVVAL